MVRAQELPLACPSTGQLTAVGRIDFAELAPSLRRTLRQIGARNPGTCAQAMQLPR